MQNKLKDHTTSYKYFHNNHIGFITSAKVGSRFMKSLSENLECENYLIPFLEKLEEIEFNHFSFPNRSEFVKHVYETAFQNKPIVFLIRNPFNRFVSGLTTNLGIIELRVFEYGEDGKNFMKHYFSSGISDSDLEKGVDKFLFTFKKFLQTYDEVYIKDLLINNILPYSIYKDSHVEFHHFMAYKYMNDLKELGADVKWIDISGLDSYIKTKEIRDWDYNSTMNKFKQTEKNTPYYKFIKDNLEAWKSQIKELSFYLDLEFEYYNKIQKEYEILL